MNDSFNYIMDKDSVGDYQDMDNEYDMITTDDPNVLDLSTQGHGVYIDNNILYPPVGLRLDSVKNYGTGQGQEPFHELNTSVMVKDKGETLDDIGGWLVDIAATERGNNSSSLDFFVIDGVEEQGGICGLSLPTPYTNFIPSSL